MLPPDWVVSWTEVIAPISTVLLTLVLVYLYNQQKNVISADHRAIIEVADYSFNEDDIEVELVNHGNGVAANVSFVTLMYTDDGQHRYCGLYKHAMERTDNTSSNSLPPSNNIVEYEGSSKIKYPLATQQEDPLTPISFALALKKFEEKGADKVHYQHVIEATDLVGEPVRKPVNPIVKTVKLDSTAVYTVSGLKSVRMDTNNKIFQKYFRHPSTTGKILRSIHLKLAYLLGYDYSTVYSWWRRDASGLKRLKKREKVRSAWSLFSSRFD